METTVRGEPTPKMQWYKDNIEIEIGGRLHILESPDGVVQLIIDKPNNKDDGKYMVRAENSAGKAECVHLVTFEGKDHHIADNIHGVFHADKGLMKPKTIEVAKKEEEDTSVGGELPPGQETPKKSEKVIGIHFSTTVTDRVVAEGTKLKISCFLESKEPQVKWFKNDEPIQNSSKIRGCYNEGLCLLEIDSTSIEDSGVYKCWARDETGECSTLCRLEVFSDPGSGDVPPTFTHNIKDSYHAKAHELLLECQVRGLPTPAITWVKDGVNIETSNRYQQIDYNDGKCELIVIDPTQSDNGTYVCQAENRAGQTEIVHKVAVEFQRLRSVPPSKESPASSQAPAPDTEGEGEGRDKKPRKKKSESPEIESRSREVPPPPDMKKRVYLRNFLSNRTVVRGSNVKWMLSIDGPEPAVRWYHGDAVIAFGPRSKMNLQDGIAWLQLNKVTEEDAGQYSVRVKGSENEVVSTCDLFVYQVGKEDLIAPVFTVGIKGKSIEKQSIL